MHKLIRERTSSQKLDWVLNTPLIQSSHFISHAYRSIAETKNFRLCASLISPFHVKKEEWTGKKLYYRKRKYIASNNDNFNVYF